MAVGSAVCASASAAALTTTQQECGNIDPQIVRSCLSRRIESKERHLTALYARALAAVADGFKKYGDFDNRTDPMFLKKSQAEWVRFVEDDCTVKERLGVGQTAASQTVLRIATKANSIVGSNFSNNLQMECTGYETRPLNHLGVVSPSVGRSVAKYREVRGATHVGDAFDLPAHGVRCVLWMRTVESVNSSHYNIM